MSYEQLSLFEIAKNDKRKENVANVFRQLGTHSDSERQQDDFYATEPLATILLCEKEKFSPTVWECCVGQGHIAEVLKQQGYKVMCSDIVDRGYPKTQIMDFLCAGNVGVWGGENKNDIITNPPYKLGTEFVKKAMDISENGVKVAMFLKIQFLESQERWELFKDYPIKTVYVSTKRLKCGKEGNFDEVGSSAMCYAWFVWQKGYKGDTIIKWINNE